MKTCEIINGLRLFNKWRRGADIDQPDPKEIGIWIDMAASRLNELEVALDRAVAYLEAMGEGYSISGETYKKEIKQYKKLLKGE